MNSRYKMRLLMGISLLATLLLILSGCNLGAAPEQEATLTVQAEATQGANATTTSQAIQGGVTVFPTLTPFVFSTRPAFVPTSIVLVPNQPPPPTLTAAPISIVIVSPLPGNVVSGTVQVVGSASHPNFLQYRLEYGPDPNPNNLWFSLTGVVQQQVLAGTLGVWPTNTGATPDGYYQLRLRVFLRDGTQQQTQVGAIRVQNNQPTPIPTITTVPRPIASFTQDVATGVAPLVVRFSNRSQGQISSYAWSFGEGGSSNAQNPTYTFRTAGTYTVILRVTGPGGSSNVSRQIVVNSPQAPVASFSPDKNTGQAPLSVVFSNTSQGQVTRYEWDFGDNTESNEQSPTHVFNDVGTYNIILRVTGPGGSSTMVQQITVENPSIPAPVADFTADPLNVETGASIIFNNSTTGQVNSFLWDFNGDGVTDNTDISPTHVYTTAGTYQVRLIAIGPGGQSQAIKQVVVTNPPNAPTASFTANPETGTAPLSVSFTNTTTGDATSYSWDFDGDTVADSTEANPSFNFQNAGTYTVTLTATGVGGSTTASLVISVDNPPVPPTADFIASPQSGDAPLLVQFTNQSVGTALSYAWDFNNDGLVDSTEESPSFSFDTAGQYTVTLNVSNAQAQSASATLVVDVTAPVIPAPVANFSFAPNGGQAPLTVNFTNESTGDISAYAWDFNNDGLADDTNTNPSFTFQTGGTYTVTLSVTGAGGSNSTSRDIVVDAALQAPVASFTTDTTSITAGGSVQFTDSSTGQVDSWFWDFGDGNTSTEQSPSHVYATDGQFTASLTVTNTAGSSLPSSVTIDVQAQLQAPVASFTTDTTSITAGGSVQFTDSSTGQVDSWFWDFGDGNTSTEQSPSHVYATDGQFTASLTVTNTAGSSLPSSVTINVQAQLQPPVASFTTDTTSITAGGSVQFTDSSTGQVDSWFWDFGDGNTSTEQSPSHVYATDGQFTASLTVTNTAGSSLPSSVTIDVQAQLQAPVASFTTDTTSITAGGSVQFTDSSTGQVDSWFWDFGDGNTSTEQSPSHVYATDGQFTASLTVTNTAGSSLPSSVTIDVQAQLQAPVASFTTDTTSITAGGSVQFTDSSTGQVDSWFWDFGDGNTSTEQSPSHVYATDGQFTASLTVTNTAGSSLPSSVTINVQAQLQPPVASFTTDTTSITAGGSVQFTDSSTGQVDSWFWDFGDGNTSTEQSPSHVYATDGQFTASLTVTNTAGSSLPSSVTIDVQAAQQTPNITGEFAFVTNRDGNNEIYVVNADGSNPVNVSQDGADDIDPAWSPDGTQLAFSSNRLGDYDIFVLTISDGTLTQITTDASDDVQARWSPDGSRLAYTRTATGNSDIYLVNVVDKVTSSWLASPANESWASWSPNGSQLVYQSDSTGQNQIFVANVDDANAVTQITNDGNNNRQPAWSSNNVIAFVASDGDNEIYTMNPDGTNVVQVTNNSANDRFPNFIPNGNRIVYTSDLATDGSGGTTDLNIYIMRPDGTEQTPYTTDGTAETNGVRR